MSVKYIITQILGLNSIVIFILSTFVHFDLYSLKMFILILLLSTLDHFGPYTSKMSVLVHDHFDLFFFHLYLVFKGLK